MLMLQETAKQTQEFLRYFDTIRSGEEDWTPRAKQGIIASWSYLRNEFAQGYGKLHWQLNWI